MRLASYCSLFALSATVFLALNLVACQKSVPEPQASTSTAATDTPATETVTTTAAPSLSLKEMMNSLLQASANELWNVALIEPPTGADKPVLTDEQWQQLRTHAQNLVEASPALLQPDLQIAPAGVVAQNGELSPEAIALLRKEKWNEWQAQVNIITDSANSALRAIEQKDFDALLMAGDPLYAVCESCHQQFWYPSQQ